MGVVEKTFRTNILSMIAICKFAVPHMKRGSSIINSSSIAGYSGKPNGKFKLLPGSCNEQTVKLMIHNTAVDYSATKGAIVTFTRALAQQQAANGIRVNAVAPGTMYVQFSHPLPLSPHAMIPASHASLTNISSWTPLQPATKGNPPDKIENLGTGEGTPLNRPGMPVEVAGAYVFLASPLGSYFTGEVIHGTGGSEMQG